MAGRIPESFIQELLNRTDIVEVIGHRVTLKKAGSTWKGLCPFHNEKTPSFVVSDKRQTYHCFGCGAHGHVIRFLMEYDHLDFLEVIDDLARLHGLTVPREEGAGARQAVSRKDDYQLLAEVAKAYQTWLGKSAEWPAAKAYLAQRGLSEEIITRFGLGYAPPGWDHLKNQFGSSYQKALIDTGMLVKNETGRVYDRFRDRIIYPIRDRRGRTIAFGGRVMGDELPKYLNSPETAIYVKGRELYGLYEALQQQRHPDKLLVVEGYMDVIALAQSGIDYAVATLGTAITPAHIDRLFKTTDRVVFCFDGDQAGRQAAWKALEVSIGVIQENRRIDFLFLPDGEDPDTLVREKGKEAFTALVENATPLSSWFFESLSHALNLSSLDGLSALVEQCKPYLNRMPDTSLRTALVAELTRLTRFRLGNESDISRLVFTSHSQPAEMEKTSRDRFKKSAQIRQRTPLRVGLALLLDNPELAHTLERPERYLVVPLPGIDLFVAVVQFIQSHDRINAAQILHHFSEDTHAAALKKLACWDHLVPEEGVQNEFKGIVQYLEQQVSQQRLHILEKKMRDGTLSAEEAQEWQQLIRHGRETR